MQTYLTTIHGNSWDCPILSSLSQLLPDTLSDLISDTRSALLRDSLWWEADKEESSNSDQAEHCSLCTSVHCMYCNQSSWLTVRGNCNCFYSFTYLWNLMALRPVRNLTGWGRTHTHMVIFPLHTCYCTCDTWIYLCWHKMKVRCLLRTMSSGMYYKSSIHFWHWLVLVVVSIAECAVSH